MPDADKILSQHEVDALLSAIDSGGGESAPDDAAEPYDFRRPSRIPPEPLRALQNLHEAFARSLQEELTGVLLKPVETRLAGVHQLPLGEFMDSQVTPSVLSLISAEPLSGRFLMAINPSIAYPIVERLLGAGRVGPPQRDRALSPLEWNVADTLIAKVLGQLEKAWATVAPAKFRVLRRESDPQLLKFDNLNEPSVVVTFEVAFEEQRGAIELAFPSMALAPYLPGMVSTTSFSARSGAAPSNAGRISEGLAPAELLVAVHLPPEPMGLRELGTLRPGDLLVTGHAVSRPLTVTVEGRPKFLGRLGSLQERKAVRILGAAEGGGAGPSGASLELQREGAAAVEESLLPEPLRGLPLELTVVLAEKPMRMEAVLGIRAGDLLEFPAAADDPLQLRVAGKTVAEGSCVRVGERLGLRILRVTAPPRSP